MKRAEKLNEKDIEKTLENRCIYYIPKAKKTSLFLDNRDKCAVCDGYDKSCEDYESRLAFYKSLERKTK